MHFNTNILTCYFLHFQNRFPTLALMHGKSSSIFYFASFQHHKTDLLCDNQSISPSQFIKTETDREGHSDVEKGALVACICRDPAETLQWSAWIVLFAQSVWDALPTKSVIIWHPGNETQQSLSYRCVWEQLGQILLILPLSVIVFKSY